MRQPTCWICGRRATDWKHLKTTEWVSTASASMINGVCASSGSKATRMMSRSQTIIRSRFLEKLPMIHPGEILREEFLHPLGITAYRLAKVFMSRRRVVQTS